MIKLFKQQGRSGIQLQTLKWKWFALLFVGAGMIGAWTPPHLNTALFHKAVFIECLLLGLFAWWSLRQITNPDCFNWVSAPVNKPLMAILIWGAASLVWSVYPEFTLVRLLFWLAVATGFFLLVAEIRSLSDWSKLILWLFISGVLIALTGIAQHLFGFDRLPQTAAPAATFINRNIAVQVIVFTLPMSVFLFFNDRARPAMPVYISVATAIIAAYLVYTQTRSGWLAVSAQGLFILVALYTGRNRLGQSQEQDIEAGKPLMAGHHKRALVLGGLLFLVLVNASDKGFISKGVFWATLETIQLDAGNFSGKQVYSRYQIWGETIEGIRQAPLLGRGLGSFEYALPDQAGPEMHNLRRAHNDYLEFIYELGLIGLCLALWLFVAFVTMIIRLWSRLSGEHYLMFVSVTAAITGSGINACFSFPYSQAIPPLFLIVCLAALVFLYRVAYPESKGEIFWPKTARAGLSCLSVALLGVVLFLNIQWIAYFNHIDRSIHTQTSNWQLTDAQQRKTLVTHPEMVHILNRLSEYSAGADPEGFMYSWNVGLANAYLKFKPYDYQPYLRLMGYYMNQGDFQRAAQLGKKAIELPVADARQAVLPWLIRSLQQLEQQDEADNYYRQLADLLVTEGNRYSAQIINEFVTLNLERNDEDNFYRVLRRCVQEYPEHWQYQAMLGIRLFKSGRKGEAFAYLNRAMELHPNNPYRETLTGWLATY